MNTRRFFAVALVVSLLVAGVASYYASSHPDGLEYVAEQTGFIDSAEDSATADSPLADYQTSGVDDARISGGLAGVIGVVVMLVLSTGLFWLVRRRGTAHADSDPDSDAAPDGVPERARRSEA
jgi:cobalt/nickel transport protein